MENKRKYKIVASDLDGTLLNKEQAVSEENLCAISEMNRLGVEFVPTTGRAMNEIDLSLMKFPDIRYIIASDGAVVFDKSIEKPILTRISRKTPCASYWKPSVLTTCLSLHTKVEKPIMIKINTTLNF